jgi:hypothetical protein
MVKMCDGGPYRSMGSVDANPLAKTVLVKTNDVEVTIDFLNQENKTDTIVINFIGTPNAFQHIYNNKPDPIHSSSNDGLNKLADWIRSGAGLNLYSAKDIFIPGHRLLLISKIVKERVEDVVVEMINRT